MYRNIYEELKDWKNKKNRKPLLIYGARQIGKTYSMLEFGKSEYDAVAYFNFENNAKLSDVFEENLFPDRIIPELSLISGINILPGKTLIIFDEIQACEKALTFLKYLNEEANEYHLMAAGSLLGLALNRGHFSFPVGKVDRLNMYPMTFDEFLVALGEARLKTAIQESRDRLTPFSEPIHCKALEIYRLYLVVGGYPEAVACYIEKKDFDFVRSVQGNISDAYIADMAKYSTPKDTVRSIAAFNSLPSQLSKENAKFMYSIIGSNSRAKDFEIAINWLESAGVVIRCNRVERGELPLKLHEDSLSFKLYYSDVGLLSNKTSIPAGKIIHNVQLSDKSRGMMAENYVAQTLVAKGIEPHYWTSGNQAEIDFVIQLSEDAVPIEVKSADNVKSKSLGVYRKKYDPTYSIRISAKNFGNENGVVSLPLYALFAL